MTPAGDERSQTPCAAGPGVAITPMVMSRSRHDLGDVVARAAPTMPADRDADQVGVDVEQRRDREPAAGEAAVAGQRVPQVADPDQGDRLAVGQAERRLHLPQQRPTS